MPVGRGFTAARQQASRLAGLAGLKPCTPHRAHRARGHSRESGLAAELPPLGNGPRGSPVWSSFVLVDKERPPFGGGPHGSLKGQRMKENTLPFCVAGISKTHRSVPSSAVYVWIVPTAEEKTRLFSAQRNYPSCNVTSQLALVEPVSRQLRRGRAAIGSGGKKARPF